MARVAKKLRVTVASAIIDEDGKEFEFGITSDVDVPRGAKLGAHTLGVAVARAATASLDLLYFGAQVSTRARKLRREHAKLGY